MIVPQEDSVVCLSPAGFHSLSVVTWGQPTHKPAVVCVHGLTRNGRDFDALAKNLGEDRLVICPDIVGRGKSDWLRDPQHYAYPQYLADMAVLLSHFSLTHVDWIGTSMGGLIGLFLAGFPRTPVRRLILNDIGPSISASVLQRVRNVMTLRPQFSSLEQGEKYIRQLLAPLGVLKEEDWQHLTHHSLQKGPSGKYEPAYDPEIIKGFGHQSQDVDLWPYWDKVSIPVYVLRGDQSAFLTPETISRMKDGHANLKTDTIAGAGHAPGLMSEHEIGLVRSFLDA